MSYATQVYGSTEYAGVLGVAAAGAATAATAETFELCVEDRGAVVRRQDDPAVLWEERGARVMPTASVDSPTFVKDPEAVKDYYRDWSELLDAGETISTSSWSGGGLTTSGAYILGERCYVFLAGGTTGTTYVAANTITTSSGRTYCREIRIVCGET